MLSPELLEELRNILSTKLKLVLSDKELKDFGEFLVTYFGALVGLDDDKN